MRRERCGGCQSPDLETFLDLGSTPLADRFPKTPDEPEDRYPLQVAVCSHCWLVQLLEVVPDDVLWSDYGFYSGTSPSSVAYFADYAQWALERFTEQARRLTVEIACNDGTLLQHFRAAGCRTVGVDPARGPWEVARERGLDALLLPFNRVGAESIREVYGQAGLIIANNVAAHVADLDDFFGGIAELLAPDGVAVVEVQYLPDLLVGNQWDHVYHEHRYYFSVASLGSVLHQHDLWMHEVVKTPQQGGSIRVVVGKRPGEGESTFVVRLGENLEQWDAYAGMQGRVSYIRDRLNDLLAGELSHATMAGYGATAKSTTLLNYCGIGPDLLEYVEDTTPAKIGRFTPGTHIPIVAPGERERPDVFLLLAWNYLPGVLRRERGFMEQGGRFLVPIPVPVLL